MEQSKQMWSDIFVKLMDMDPDDLEEAVDWDKAREMYRAAQEKQTKKITLKDIEENPKITGRDVGVIGIVYDESE